MKDRSSSWCCWLPGCFSFLQRPPPSKISSPKSIRSIRAQFRRFPSLDQACLEARGSCVARARLSFRQIQVASKLAPVVFFCSVDFFRRDGPRYVAENSRRLRLALEALGPAFVKLGQAAASREDILSDAIVAELRRLCDQVAPFPNDEAQLIVQQELGPWEPSRLGQVVASASLGQVYCVSVCGSKYALKVQRPGLAGSLARDVVILKGAAKFGRRILRLLCETPLDPVAVVESWALTMWDELDYRKEAQNSELMRSAFLGKLNGILIPRVHWQMSSLRVLATEWVDGFKVTDHPKCVKPEHVKVGVEAFASMILEMGVVHADPHAGNLIIADAGRKVCLLDFGMVVRVPDSHRRAWANCVIHLVRMEHEAVLDDLIDIGFFSRECPREEILPVMSKIWTQLVECGSDIQKRKQAVKMLYNEILTLIRRFRFELPDYYVAIVRALVTLEGIALSADCEFDIFKAIFPVACRFISRSAETTAVFGQALVVCGFRCLGDTIFAGISGKPVTASAVASATALTIIAWMRIVNDTGSMPA